MSKSILLGTIAICIMLTLGACSNNTNNSDSHIKSIKFDLSKVRPIKRGSELFSEISLVKLETSPTVQIGEIIKIFVNASYIYISDGKSVYQFDVNGKYLNQLNSQGKGPGEYTGITDFVVAQNNTIEVLNTGQQKVIRFDRNFKFIDEYKVGRYTMNMAIHNNGTRLFHCGNDASGDQFDKILRFNNGILEEGYLTIDKFKSEYLHFRRFDFFSYFNNGILITDVHHDTVYHYSQKGFEPRYVMDIGKKAIPTQMYNRSYDHVADFSLNHLKGSGYMYGILNFIETNKHLFFHFVEHTSVDDNEYGRKVPVYIHHNKLHNSNEVFYRIVDDVNFHGDPLINEFTTFFSQPNGMVAYAIEAVEFIEMHNESSKRAAEQSNKTYIADELAQSTKPTDNHIIAIGRLK
ncbi:6-bladed beta-propeller [Perlabentimonas gracilis]|uniref:6-bladed beta-propeller n=1 Tax=Perlabentimonas gracilis TaxID=2715279 RepID=UPI00140DD5FE|nr:6-bladed beta-propeller [Perlabentimonas gracilis]NHB69266.1 6-bladed beta-propeller [Perlabentimonas gracilis]